MLWKALPRATKCGNSKATHRIDLMKRFLRIIPASDVKALTMDREFIGKEWLQWTDNRRRWGIEQVFSHFKKRCFDLKTTLLSAPEKIETLFGVLTLAFMIS